MTVVLQEKIVVLESEISTLKTENDSLKAKIIELEDKLGLNSQNSSLPPSHDIYRKKSKEKSGKKTGGQPGHKAHKRELMAADEIVDCPVDSVCACGGEIVLEGEVVHQKVELPEIKPFVTEYRLQKGRCKACNRRVSAGLPHGVSRDLLGPNAKTIISSFSGFFINSKREVQQIASSIFNLKISLGLISNTEHRVSKKCAPEYEKIREELQESEYLHIDETGHRNKGKRGWGWVITNKTSTLLKLAESRGKKVLKSLLPEYEGIVVSDRYAAYNYFNRKNRQICWAHLARDFERFAYSKNIEVSKIGWALKSLSNKVFAVHKAAKRSLIEDLRFYRLMRKIRKRVKYFLRKMTIAAKGTQASRMCANMLRSEDMMWKFLQKPKVVETTNNLAEQQVRRYVIYRKNSFFTWSGRGERFIERMLSIFLTSRLNNQNPGECSINCVKPKKLYYNEYKK